MDKVGLLNPNKMYAYYKNLHDKTKPIRGRAVECRPIGDRRRDWEQIRMVDESVACRLYDTDVVTYHPDGRVTLRCDSWATPTTADFIWTHSPFKAYKANRKIWVDVNNIQYPIPNKGEIEFHIVEGKWEPTKPVVVEKKVIDRKKSKEAYAPLQKFIEHIRVMLTMSDGWIMDATMQELSTELKTGYYDYKYNFDVPDTVKRGSNATLYQYIATCPEEKYTELFLQLTQYNRNWVDDSRVARTITAEQGGHSYEVRLRDAQYNFKRIKDYLYRIARETTDVNKVVTVEPSHRAMTNVK